MVPRRVRRRQKAALPAPGRLRAERRSVARLWCVSKQGGAQRARAVRDRRRRNYPLDLLLAGRRESRRRRNPRRTRGHAERPPRGGLVTSRRASTPTLRPPVHEGDHTLGAADAPVTLVEYGDYQCPHCYRAHPIVLALQKKLGDRLRFVFRNFPLTEAHPDALHAAEAAESVAAHTGDVAFWKMHHAIYEHQQDSDDALDDAHLVRYAAT